MTTMRSAAEPSGSEPDSPRQRKELDPSDIRRPFLWYTAAGIITTGLQALLFLAIRDLLGSVAANLVALTITTLANSEFHRRVTFAGYPNRSARLHLQSLLTFAFYASYGSLVLILLKAIVDQPSAQLETIVLVVASLGGGIARFLILRWWVFSKESFVQSSEI